MEFVGFPTELHRDHLENHVTDVFQTASVEVIKLSSKLPRDLPTEKKKVVIAKLTNWQNELGILRGTKKLQNLDESSKKMNLCALRTGSCWENVIHN